MLSRCGRPSCQYSAFFVATRRSPGIHSPNAYGPVPTGCDPSASGSAAAVGDTIIPGRSARICTSELSGRLRAMRTCVGSTTSTDSIIERSAFTVDVSSVMARSRFALTAAASNGVPSWNVTPSRSVSSSVCGSGDDHSVASPGSGVRSIGSRFTRRS